MAKIKSVSVIIPLFRRTAYIEDILKLDTKLAQDLEFILVIDNPKQDFIKWVKEKAQNSKKKIEVLVNEKNIGASKSRNKGIENAKGDLILFLDDDVIPEKKLIDYHIVEIEKSETFGVIGTTIMNFDKNKKIQYAIGKAGFDYSFRLYRDYKKHSWGPTCNISFLKEKIRDNRFDDCYPKAGGGEDVDFCWDIGSREEQSKMIVSETAKAIHPPWAGIKSIYKRINRWGYADAILFTKQPERRYIDWPNYPEANILLLISSIILGAVLNPWLFLQIPIHIIFSFVLTGFYQTYDSKSDLLTGQIIQSLRIWHHMGRIKQILLSFRFHRFFYRTQYFDSHTPKKIRRKTFTEFLLILFSYFITILGTLLLIYLR